MTDHKVKIDNSRIFVESFQTFGGATIWTATAAEVVGPVGVVVTIQCGSEDGKSARVDTAWSYVREEFRRMGVRTAIHKAIQRAYPDHDVVFITGTGSDSGKPWMEAMGFKYSKRLSMWNLRCNKDRSTA